MKKLMYVIPLSIILFVMSSCDNTPKVDETTGYNNDVDTANADSTNIMSIQDADTAHLPSDSM